MRYVYGQQFLGQKMSTVVITYDIVEHGELKMIGLNISLTKSGGTPANIEGISIYKVLKDCKNEQLQYVPIDELLVNPFPSNLCNFIINFDKEIIVSTGDKINIIIKTDGSFQSPLDGTVVSELYTS